ncbi:dihydropteroate synthase [Acetomicrobium hydrogeniformans ATCC BAA-1850]|uniref:Dihydropteroate synthase n=2 Tax=Acetomicrobium hydrogeniformans TaxID=649746 RepID=A0A0T5XBE0_9BACT|nr:dihydropteroate synthase [Acetomicrobium hydrogeniformans ATCC BAA-1850]
MLPGNRKLNLGERPMIMGILNLTFDSFYPQSRIGDDKETLLQRAEKMIEDGADILDIGAESTRPGAEPLSLEEEMRRLIPGVESLRKNFPEAVISVDTYKAAVAEAAVEAGADIINDISGLSFDSNMADTIARLGVPVIIMHIKGTPKDMQKDPRYDDVIGEIKEFLEDKMALAAKSGIKREQIVLDPGLGFGKRNEDNLCILKNIREFRSLGRPILIGHSRKGTISKVLGCKGPEEALYGTLAISAYCALNGVEILRVHDVLENKQVVTMISAIQRA